MYSWTFTFTYRHLSYLHYRRKFRSQPIDSMDRWKSRGEKSPGGEEKKWEDQRVEREGRKKRQVRKKVGKSRFTVFFQWFVALEGQKVGLRRQLARWEINKFTPLWCEAHFQVKMHKAHQLRTTFGSWHVEEVHGVAGRSTFPSQNAQRTPFSDHFWKFRCPKSARHCDTKHISKSKV